MTQYMMFVSDESHRYGPGVVREFLKKNKLKTLVRSHQCVGKGWDEIHCGDYQISLLCCHSNSVQVKTSLSGLFSVRQTTTE